MKNITIIIQNAPYQSDNKAWHALRFAGAALKALAAWVKDSDSVLTF